MKWSRELRVVRRSMRTAMRAATFMATTRMRQRASLPEAPDRVNPGFLEIDGFGSNPGRLAMQIYLPGGTARSHRPLIVLLHGCGQAAASFAQAAGWTTLANQLEIPLVLAEQAEENNRGRCFNWFLPGEIAHGQGEGLSIRQMVETAVRRFGSDPRRIFIAGLSAGGAMTAALLAAYPDVFAAGAIVAGLPVGAAGSVTEALRRMAEAGPHRSPTEWAEQARRLGPAHHSGAWPRVSIWHGADDRVVDPANAQLIAAQWSALHGLAHVQPEATDLPNARCDRWTAAGQPVVELWSLPGVGHQWPRGATNGIAKFWQIAAD